MQECSWKVLCSAREEVSGGEESVRGGRVEPASCSSSRAVYVRMGVTREPSHICVLSGSTPVHYHCPPVSRPPARPPTKEKPSLLLSSLLSFYVLVMLLGRLSLFVSLVMLVLVFCFLSVFRHSPALTSTK